MKNEKQRRLKMKPPQLFKVNNKNSNILEVEVKNYGECGFCKEEKETLNIPWSIYSQWLFLLNQIKGKEWGGVLTIKDKTVTEFKIPKQEVDATNCEFKEELGGEGIIHSHHDMGAFHSGQDDNHARNLYTYSIVISTTGIITTKQKKLPCGGFGYINVDLKIIDSPIMDLSKIKEKNYIAYDRKDYPYNNFPFANFPSNEKEVNYVGQCNSCLKEDKVLESYEIDGNAVLLCEECIEKHFSEEETFICSNCMQDFDKSEMNIYGQEQICDKCWNALAYNE
jgi:hypothetical protein